MQRVDKFRESKVPGMLAGGGTELGEKDATSVFPLHPCPSMNGVGEGQPHEVTPTLGKATWVPQRSKSLIPCHKVKPLAEEAGRCRLQGGKQSVEFGRGALGTFLGSGIGKTGESAKVPVSLFVEAKRTRQSVDDVGGGGDRPALFKPRVPGHPHARDLGYLFPPQPWRVAPSRSDTQLDILGLELGTAHPKKRRQLGAPRAHGI